MHHVHTYEVLLTSHIESPPNYIISSGLTGIRFIRTSPKQQYTTQAIIMLNCILYGGKERHFFMQIDAISI